MPGWTTYRGLQVPDDTPSGAAGVALKDDLKLLVDWSPKSNYAGSGDPTAYDDASQNYYPGSLWLSTPFNHLFVCVSSAAGAAVWKRVNNFPLSTGGAVVVTDGGGEPVDSGISSTQLNYLINVTSDIQTQLNANASAASTASSDAAAANSNATAAGAAAASAAADAASAISTANTASSTASSASATATAAAADASTANTNASAAATAAAAASAAVSALSSSLAPVATSGAYSSLSGLPTIPTQTSQLTNDSGFMVGSNNLSDLGTLSTARYNLFGGNSPVADGTYTVGIGTTQNGTITIVNGLITAIQQAT